MAFSEGHLQGPVPVDTLTRIPNSSCTFHPARNGEVLEDCRVMGTSCVDLGAD